jgi:membrane-bound metal-dependent hydrolase YbcI (DUF457 family)
MPFSLSHVAAVMPIARRPLVTSALVVGAVVPDVPYYLPLPISGQLTHSLAGAFFVDVSLGATLLAAYHGLAVAPLRALAPAGIRARLPAAIRVRRGSAATLRWLAAVVVSMLIGVLTHVLWDSFTHTEGAAVQGWAPLRAEVIGPHRVYNVIQYVSSVGGLLVIAWWLRRWYGRTEPDPGDTKPEAPGLPRGARRAVWSATAVAGVAGALALALSPAAETSAYDFVRSVLLGATGGLAGAFAVYVLGWQMISRARPDRDQR